MGKRKKYALSIHEIIDKWAKRWQNVMTWLAKYPNEKTRQQKAQLLWIFCDWAKITPDELLALKDDISSRKAERLLDKFVADQTIEVPNSVKWDVINAVKGFFRRALQGFGKESWENGFREG